MKLFSLLLLQSLCLAASLLNLSPTKASSSSWTARRLKLGQLNMVATAPAETAIGGKDSETSRVKDFAVHSDGKLVDMHFSDGTAYTYHALWLRDACRDVNHVVANVGERQLTATAAMLETPEQLAVKSVDVSESGDVKIEWNSGLNMIDSIENTVQYSTFSSNFLRLYADVVAKPIKTNDKSHKKEEMEWLRPYTGYPDACAPKPSMINLWTNTDRKAGKFEFQRFQYSDAIAKNLDFMKTLLRDGAVLVDHVPECPDAAELLDFTYRTMGGLQKDPTRDEPNWKITKKDGATSISYAHDKRLINHTDQSIPPHGLPGLVLVMHYLQGSGANTLADGYAAAKRLREIDPEAFELLATYPYDGERDFIASRVDSTQEHKKSLLVSRKNPIFTLDPNGDLLRIMFNEVFRTPLTLPFDVFPKYFQAFNKFVQLIHSEEFEVVVDMSARTFLVMDNWRILHGRAGNRATPSRTVVGGTITREAFFSRATQLMNCRDEILGTQM